MNAEPHSRSAPSSAEPVAYVASHGQRRLWVLQEMDPESTAYNLPGALLLEGPLDIASLKSALQDLIGRHESLRTTFAVRGDQVCQLVHSTIRPYFEEFDLRSASDPETAARQLAAENASQPFDLRQGPLLRVKLLRCAAEKHVLAYSLHHIISDDASNAVLVRELNILYSARVAGMSNPLPPLDLQYRDFASWQNQELSSPKAAEHRQYWLDKFAGELPTLELAPDFPRPPVKTFSGRCFVTTWEPEFLDRLVRFAQAEKTTLFLLLLALVRVQLFRYTNQPDITIGTAVEGREEPEHHADQECEGEPDLHEDRQQNHLNGHRNSPRDPARAPAIAAAPDCDNKSRKSPPAALNHKPRSDDQLPAVPCFQSNRLQGTREILQWT